MPTSLLGTNQLVAPRKYSTLCLLLLVVIANRLQCAMHDRANGCGCGDGANRRGDRTQSVKFCVFAFS